MGQIFDVCLRLATKRKFTTTCTEDRTSLLSDRTPMRAPWPEGDSEPQRFVTNTETATALRDHRREENNAPRFASHNFASSGVKEAVSNRFEIIHNEKGASTHCPSVARLLGC